MDNMENNIQNTQASHLNSDIRKKEMLLAKLESKLGKSRNEVRKMMSDSLLSLLAKVPFNIG